MIAVALLSGCIEEDQAGAVDLVRRDRVANGVDSINSDVGAIAAAQAHAGDMAINRSLYHSKLSLGVNECAKGENVGHGPSVAAIEQAFMNSPAHRRNILDPQFDHVGIGVTRWHGEVWVVQLFIDRC